MTGNHGMPDAATQENETALSIQDPKLLRSVFGAFATGVTVVTVGGAIPHAMTANAFTSVSLDPPLILICVNRDTMMHDALISSQSFAVSVLAGHQEKIACYFADRWRARGQTQFDWVTWSPGTHSDAPLLSGALAWLECSLWRAYDGGDHSIFVGRLLSMGGSPEKEALLFFGGQFFQLTRGTP